MNVPNELTASLDTSSLFFALVSRSLYAPYLLGGNGERQIREVRSHSGRYDMYCPFCKKQSTWIPVVHVAVNERRKLEALGNCSLEFWKQPFDLRTSCSRDTSHSARFVFHVVDNLRSDAQVGQKANVGEPTLSIIKIGQYPSVSDFQIGDLSHIEEGMTDQQRKEFVQAINTGAHGFSVAACVYLRRVFEAVLLDAKLEYMAEHGLTAWGEFDAARTDERIRLLRSHLPQFLAEHPHLYGVLSLGVHELTEQECAEELPMLRQAIELILMDRAAALQQRKHRAAVSKLVAQAANRLKNR